MTTNVKSFQNIIDSIQVASGYQETKIPFIRPKQVSRFRPMGLEPKIDIASFGQVINRTLYLTFKYLWFRDKKRPTDRIVVDIADGSFDFDFSEKVGWFDLDSKEKFKVFRRGSRYLDLTLSDKNVESPEYLVKNNIKYLMSDYYLTLTLYLSIFLEYFSKTTGLQERRKLLAYILACDTDTFDKTLAVNAAVVNEFNQILKNLSVRRAGDVLSIYPIANFFVNASDNDDTIPFKLSLLARLFFKEYFGQNLTKILESPKLISKVLLGDVLTDAEKPKVREASDTAYAMLKDGIEILFSNLAVDFSREYSKDTPIDKIKISNNSGLKGTTGFLVVVKDETPENILPFFRNNCLFFEDTVVAERIWSGEGDNVFEKSFGGIDTDSFFDLVSAADSLSEGELGEAFEKISKKLISAVNNGLITQQFLKNAYKNLIPEDLFKTVTGSDKPETYNDLRRSILRIVKGMPVLASLSVVKIFEKNLEENAKNLARNVQNFEVIKALAMSDAAAYSNTNLPHEFRGYLKDSYNRSNFQLYSLRYEIKRSQEYLVDQGIDIPEGVRTANLRALPSLGSPVLAFIAANKGFVLLFLVLTLGSLWTYFFHKSPLEKYVESLDTEISEIRAKFETGACRNADSDYCKCLNTKLEKLEELKLKAKQDLATQKGVVDSIVYSTSTLAQEVGDTTKTLGRILRIGLYGALGLGAVWGGLKVYGVYKKTKKLSEEKKA